jgi:transcriptional regulator with XRE-family HTH domain
MEQLNLHWLRSARRNKKLRLEAVAERIGKDRSTLWRYEAGEIPLNVDVLFQLLSIYNVSIIDVVMVTTRKDDSHDL